MAVPDFQSLMRPVLQTTADGHLWTNKEILETVANECGLTQEDRAERLVSGQTRLQNRIAWAIIYLSRAGALRRERRGISEITDRGRLLLTENPDRIDIGVLDQFPEFQEFRSRRRTSTESRTASDTLGAESGDPIERIEAAVQEINATVASDLLERIKAQPPEFLEHLILQLMRAMDYGVLEDSAQHLGGPGDEGFDGVIRLDALGLERVYLQAKRYSEATIGRPAIHSFVGALTGAGATRGVFITTSSFSREAVEYAKRIPMNLVLIDGSRLGELLIRYGVGVSVKEQVSIVAIDEDFFE